MFDKEREEKRIKKQDSFDIKTIYLFSDKQGWIKGYNINKDSTIRLEKEKDGIDRTLTIDKNYSTIYDIEDRDRPDKPKQKYIIAGHTSSVGIDVLANVREGTPNPTEFTVLWDKRFMEKFHALQDIKQPLGSVMNIILGAIVTVVGLFVLKTFAGITLI